MSVLSTLLAEAHRDRSAVEKGLDVVISAVATINRLLSEPLPQQVECSRYVQRLIANRHLACTSIARLDTSFDAIRVPALVAQALAVAIDELLQSVDASAVPTETLKVRICATAQGDHLLVGLGVEGKMRIVGPRTAMHSLVRAAAIVACLGGELQRGVDDDRIVIGITIDLRMTENC